MSLLGFVVVLCCVCLVHAAPQSDTHQYGSGENSTSATIFAIEYAYPLQAWTKVAESLLLVKGTNALLPNTELSTANSTVVVAPNVDTLYSIAAFDLSGGNVIVTVPEVDAGRYWSVSFYDPFGDNFAVIGSVSSSPTGSYALCWSQRDSRLCPECHRQDAGVIVSPVAYGTILIRILVKNNGTDLTHVQQLIDNCTMEKAAELPPTSPEVVLPLTLAQFAIVSVLSFPRNILELTALTLDASPPFNVSSPAAIVRELKEAGVHGGSYNTPNNVNLTATSNDASGAVAAYQEAAFKLLNNGWAVLSPQGLYGSNYVARAFVAVSGYLALVPSEALYPEYAAGTLSLDSGEAYIYTFSSKPPLGPTGFWSLTMYNATDYLVANPLNVYAIGDRSNLTYSDGSPVYGTGASASDGSFQVLVQSAANPPPANWTNNWLPSPEADGPFNVIFRLYSPTSALADGSWLYPEITKVSAIVV